MTKSRPFFAELKLCVWTYFLKPGSWLHIHTGCMSVGRLRIKPVVTHPPAPEVLHQDPESALLLLLLLLLLLRHGLRGAREGASSGSGSNLNQCDTGKLYENEARWWPHSEPNLKKFTGLFRGVAWPVKKGRKDNFCGRLYDVAAS